MPRRTYDARYKVEVASMVVDQDLSIQQVAEATSVGPTAIRRWVDQLSKERSGQPSEMVKPITAEQRKIRELEARIPEFDS